MSQYEEKSYLNFYSKKIEQLNGLIATVHTSKVCLPSRMSKII